MSFSRNVDITENQLDLVRKTKIPSQKYIYIPPEYEFPFENLPQPVLRKFVENIVFLPYRKGITEELVYNIFGIKNHFSKTKYIYEIHLDCKKPSKDVEYKLFELGWGVDFFYMFYPKSLDMHYTIKFEIADKNILPEIKSYLEKVLKETAILLKDQLWGYVETEFYSAQNRKRYRYIPISGRGKEELDNLIEAKKLNKYNLPIEFGSMYIDGKKADIHVKIQNTKDVVKELQNIKNLEILEEKLSQLGFYKVITGRGNIIFTGQFIFYNEAVQIFKELNKIFTNYGGVSELTLEFVRDFYYSQKGNKIVDIPYILSLKNL